MANFRSTVTPCAPRPVFPQTPFLGVSDRGVVVMFYSNDGLVGRGVVLNPGDGAFSVGHHSTDWTMRRFQPFNGQVTVTTA